MNKKREKPCLIEISTLGQAKNVVEYLYENWLYADGEEETRLAEIAMEDFLKHVLAILGHEKDVLEFVYVKLINKETDFFKEVLAELWVVTTNPRAY